MGHAVDYTGKCGRCAYFDREYGRRSGWCKALTINPADNQGVERRWVRASDHCASYSIRQAGRRQRITSLHKPQWIAQIEAVNGEAFEAGMSYGRYLAQRER